jgi:hypothetical protein
MTITSECIAHLLSLRFVLSLVFRPRVGACFGDSAMSDLRPGASACSASTGRGIARCGDGLGTALNFCAFLLLAIIFVQ